MRNRSLLTITLLASTVFMGMGRGNLNSKHPEKAWKRAGFSEVTIEKLSDDLLPATHEFDLTLVLFRETGWTREQVMMHVDRAREVFLTCGIRFSNLSLVTTDPYRGYLDSNRIRSGNDYDIASATPLRIRPVVYFIRHTLIVDGQGGGSYSSPEYVSDKRDPLLNTAWIVSDINSPEYWIIRDPYTHQQTGSLDRTYSVVAHEIAHLLGNRGHIVNGIPNLLAGDRELLNGTLTPDQCEDFKRSPLVRLIR